MSKSSQNNFYYEVAVYSSDLKEVVAEYVTRLPIIKKGHWIHEKLTNLLKIEHGENIMVLWNKKYGEMPKNNLSVIDVNIPDEPELNYNK